jgi:hypothetical protein
VGWSRLRKSRQNEPQSFLSQVQQVTQAIVFHALMIARTTNHLGKRKVTICRLFDMGELGCSDLGPAERRPGSGNCFQLTEIGQLLSGRYFRYEAAANRVLSEFTR